MIPRYSINFDLGDMPKVYCDYLVVGSGIAGLYAALKASKHGNVIMLTKKKVEDSNTEKAQGGIAAAIDHSKDSPYLHFEDTIEAGAGLCDRDAVEVLVKEGPDRIWELINLGTNFDRIDNELALTREGAHSRRRILHARGDATGEEIRRALARQVLQEKLVQTLEDHFVVDLITKGGRCYGVIAWDAQKCEYKFFASKVMVLATGGVGQLYKNTTNPYVATGDGLAMAYRAGAEVMDMEFVQFHPTGLYLANAPRFLISEAVRGEGAVLRTASGERFMPKYHAQAELAPRDVVARAIIKEMEISGTNHVYLDLTHLGKENIASRFPNITQTCAKYGLDIINEMIPVAPAAHYMMGGVKTNLNGETNLKGLYSCGEAACLGVHGANRLASNSLLDGLVFGERIVQHSRSRLVDFEFLEDFNINNHNLCDKADYDPKKIRTMIQEIMWEKVGIVREQEELQAALEQLRDLSYIFKDNVLTIEMLEVKNMLAAGMLITEGALLRTESRGGHYRRDYPQRSDALWQKHVVLQR